MDFALRRFLQWTPHPYQEIPSSFEALFPASSPNHAEALRLWHGYALATSLHNASSTRIQETFTYLYWLESAFKAIPSSATQSCFQQSNAQQFATQQAPFSCLDVGAKNWSYVAAIPAFLQAQGIHSFVLDGVELDPHRRYADFHTRGQYAQAYSRNLPNTHYHECDILQWHKPAHLITHFLPFVLPDPHLAWGLPLQHFRPQAMLEHLLSLLHPQGILFIVNQGKHEADAQAALLQHAATNAPISIQSLGQLPSPFIQYRYPRYGWLCRKEGTPSPNDAIPAHHYISHPQ